MKKIMFNDKYGLTQSVLDGRKTMTRRMAYSKDILHWLDIGYDTKTHQCLICDGESIVARSQYKVGEVVAIAQSYGTLANSGYLDKMMDGALSMKKEYAGAGYKNKMFVKAELMPHHLKITSIRVEHLQEISDEDCLREGIRKWDKGCNPLGPSYDFVNSPHGYATPREAFAALIDRVSGKGTWNSNPMVWIYEFELVD